MDQSDPNKGTNLTASGQIGANPQNYSQGQPAGGNTSSQVNTGINPMTFSTITKKAPKTNLSASTVNPKTVDMFKSYISSQLTQKDQSAITEADQLRKSQLLDVAHTALSIQKKSKKLGKIIHREGTLEAENFFNLSQIKKKKKKEYQVPLEFLPQTREEYNQTKRGLPWPNDSKLGQVEYRILYNRSRPSIKGGSEVQKSKAKKDEFDSYFIFKTQEEFLKVRNYLFCLKLLDSQNPQIAKPVPDLLQALSQSVRLQLIAKLRGDVKLRAENLLKQNKKQKDDALENSRLLRNFDNYMAYNLILEAVKKARKLNEEFQYETEANMLKKSRLQLLQNSKLLRFYDKSLANRFLSDWHRLSEKLKRPDSQRIQILFKSIELPAQIVKPTFKIFVMVEKNNAFKGPLVINGEQMFSDTKELTAIPVIKKKTSQPTLIWRLSPASLSYDHMSPEKEGLAYREPYSITLDSIPEAAVELIRFKFNVYDENDKLRALYYVKLEHLFKSSQKGRDISLNLGTGSDGLSHLLHLGVISQSSSGQQESEFTKCLNDDYIQDINFNYSFSFPHITPRHHKFISLLPESWKAIDEDLKNTHRTGNLGKWVQKVKYRLARHYHRNSSRQLANLEYTNQLWASLQEDLTRYALIKPKGSENIFIDEENLQKMLAAYRPDSTSTQPEKTTKDFEDPEFRALSYLFKRDRWESHTDWRQYYPKLFQICHRGIPPQLRKIIWSELGRVCYFVELTEMFLPPTDFQNRAEVYYRGHRDEADSKTTKSRVVYEKLKWEAFKEFYYLYQELEEDIDALREKQGKEKLDYESSLRHICRTFIYWSHLFANINKNEVKYYVSYSRAIVTLCQNLIIGLSCSYLQSEVFVEEDVVFWLLISITTYILASYYETNEQALSVDVVAAGNNTQGRKKNKITVSALRCPEIKGIKGDLLLLKLLLKEIEPEILFKFEELGLPLEEFFADHMLTLFSTMLSPGLTYRIWDIIFLEGSASNQVRSHRTIVITIFTILRNCKQLILSAKTYKDLSIALELYCKFEVRFDEFLEKVQQNLTQYLEQMIPESDGIIKKINYIKFAIFSGTLGKFDNHIKEIEDRIQSYHSIVHQRNSAVFGLVNTSFRSPSSASTETLNYAKLSDMIRRFISLYTEDKKSSPLKKDLAGGDNSKLQTNIYADSPTLRRGVLKPKLYAITLVIHRVSFVYPDFDSLLLRVSHDKDHFDKVGLSGLNIQFAAEFELKELPARKFHIEIYDNKIIGNPRKIKWTTIDLKSLDFDIPSKLILKFNEADQLHNDNFTTSEVELTILLTSAKTVSGSKGSSNESKEFVIPELHNSEFPQLSQLKLPSILNRQMEESETFIQGMTPQNRFAKSKNTWKESKTPNENSLTNFHSLLELDFAIDYEQFLSIMNMIAPFWATIVDWNKIYSTLKRGSSDQTFYLNDLFTLMILFGKFSFREKMNLLFLVHSFCSDVFKYRGEDEISLNAVKGIARDLYQAFMIYLPYNEIDNMIDNLVTGSSSIVLRAVVNGDTDKKIELSPTGFNRIANNLHLHYFTKDIYVGDIDILQFVKTMYTAEVSKLKNASQFALNSRNSLEIHYLNNGMRHQFKIEFSDKWTYLSSDSSTMPTKIRSTMKMLYNSKSVLPLNHHDRLLNSQEFVKIFESLPLIDYLCGFECIKAPQEISLKTDILYMLSIDGEDCFSVLSVPFNERPRDQTMRSTVIMPSSKSDRKALKFRGILREWMNLIFDQSNQAARNLSELKKQSKGPTDLKEIEFAESKIIRGPENYEFIRIRKIQEKISIYFPIRKLVTQLKRYLIKEIYRRLVSNPSSKSGLNPKLLNENLYQLDYEIEIIVNGTKRKVISNHDLSVYDSIFLVEGAFESGEHHIDSIEARINLTTSKMKMLNKKDTYDQLALYRYADTTTEWLPCRILNRYRLSGRKSEKGRFDERPSSDLTEGFVVVFQDFPNEKVLKHKNEVALVHDVNMDELEMIQISEEEQNKYNLEDKFAQPGFKQQSFEQQGFKQQGFEQPGFREFEQPGFREGGRPKELTISNQIGATELGGADEEEVHQKTSALARKPGTVQRRNY